MRRPFLALALLAPALTTQAAAQEAAARPTSELGDLKVLLVSHDPEAPQVPFPDLAHERHAELYGERAALWEALLREHFKDVRVVYGEDYQVAMSAEADVTVFDARPSAFKQAVREQGNYQPAEYLPRDFSHAAVTISDNSPRIGEPLGLKLDWL